MLPSSHPQIFQTADPAVEYGSMRGTLDLAHAGERFSPPPEEQHPRPYALLLLRGLQLRFFREKSDWTEAACALALDHVRVHAYLFDENTGHYEPTIIP